MFFLDNYWTSELLPQRYNILQDEQNLRFNLFSTQHFPLEHIYNKWFAQSKWALLRKQHLFSIESWLVYKDR